jgi:hypothetical protein
VDAISLHFDTVIPPGSRYLYNSVFYSKEKNSDGISKFDGLPPGKWRLRISNDEFPDKELDVELSGDKSVRHQVIFGSASSKAAEMEALARLIARKKTPIESLKNDSNVL